MGTSHIILVVSTSEAALPAQNPSCRDSYPFPSSLSRRPSRLRGVPSCTSTPTTAFLSSHTFCGFSTLFPQTWSSFVACIKDYSSSCMNADERTDINRAVGDSINSVHKICTNVDYRRGNASNLSCLVNSLKMSTSAEVTLPKQSCHHTVALFGN